MRLFAAISTAVISIMLYVVWTTRAGVNARTAALEGPQTGAGVAPGEVLRADGKIAEVAKLVAAIDHNQGCVAASTRVDYVWVEKVDVGHGSERKYEDQRFVKTLFEERVGTDPIPVEVEGGTVLVPRQLWPAHDRGKRLQSQKPPAWLDERPPAHDGVFMAYETMEACLRPGDPVFVRGVEHARDEAGVSVTAGPGGTRLELSRGTQADAVARADRQSQTSSRWLYGLTAAQVLVLIALAVSEVRRR